MQCCEGQPEKPCYMVRFKAGGKWVCLYCGKPPKQAKIEFQGSKVRVFDARNDSTVVLVDTSSNLEKMAKDVISAARKKGYAVSKDRFGRLPFQGVKIT